MSYGMVPPPPSLGGASSSAKPPLSKRELDRKKEQEYNSLLEGVTTSRLGSKKRTIIGDDYFENDSDEEDFTDRGRDHKGSSGDRRNERFQSRESSKVAESKKNTANDEEDDELEAFMAEINQQVCLL
uniref:Uncharacterized protein n=1 Tax=Acrobeloides nanus TaxID=290746 RepID=A0A914CSF7_9BILA